MWILSVSKIYIYLGASVCKAIVKPKIWASCLAQTYNLILYADLPVTTSELEAILCDVRWVRRDFPFLTWIFWLMPWSPTVSTAETRFLLSFRKVSWRSFEFRIPWPELSTKTPKYESVSKILKSLHWLSLQKRITLKTAIAADSEGVGQPEHVPK